MHESGHVVIGERLLRRWPELHRPATQQSRHREIWQCHGSPFQRTEALTDGQLQGLF